MRDVDVVVVGGGTAGISAAIAAARQGRSVLLAEVQAGVGGTGTLGLITRPYHGLPQGFAREITWPGDGHTVEDKMEALRTQLCKAGGEIWLGVTGCGAIADGNHVRGVTLASTAGTSAVIARVVIDATGAGEIAIAAGAAWMYGADAHDIALQGAGLPTRPLRTPYVNTDYILVDENDMIAVQHTLLGALMTMPPDAYDVGPLLQTRERTRMVGDFVMRYIDQIAGRTYDDAIVVSSSDYDSHGYTSHPYFALFPHDESSLKATHPAPSASPYTPYRCLLPKGMDGILVVGLGISMGRDASALMRMQFDIHNQGYAAGVAAAMAVARGCALREIDVPALQRHLVDVGCLPQDVLSLRESFPLDALALESAVADMTRHPAISRAEASRALARVLAHPDTCRSLLLGAWQTSRGDARLTYAKTLGFLGETCVVPDLLAALEKAGPWDAKILQGKMAEYGHLPTHIDALILALGYAQDVRALPELIRRVDSLDAGVTLSHHRSLALALERMGDPAAAPSLHHLLRKPGMCGHEMTSLAPLYNEPRERRRRTAPLREITLARALYRCSDHGGLGEAILRNYLKDVRGPLARHAQAVLAGG